MRKNNSIAAPESKTLNTKKTNRAFQTFKKDLGAWLLILPAILCLYFFTIRPQILGISWSFFNMRGFTPTEFVGLDNYVRVLKDTAFLKAVYNTLLNVLYAVVIGFPLPFLLALVMNEMVHFRKLTRVLIYVPNVMPAMAVSLLWYFMYFPDASGLLNIFLGKLGLEPYEWLQDPKFSVLGIQLSMIWNGMGGTSLYYFAAMQGINRELYEAAMIDGAGYFKRLWIVTLPYMYGMIILFFIRQIIFAFNIMEQVLQMTDGGPNNASITLGLLNYRYGFVIGRPNLAMALSVMMFIFLSIFAVIYFKANKKIEGNQM